MSGCHGCCCDSFVCNLSRTHSSFQVWLNSFTRSFALRWINNAQGFELKFKLASLKFAPLAVISSSKFPARIAMPPRVKGINSGKRTC